MSTYILFQLFIWLPFNFIPFVTCDQASRVFFFAVGRNAWYNYSSTICLLLVQNLDFSLIGQETKGT